MAITETSEKEDIGFLNNVEKHHTASTSKGGTAIYVNKKFDTIACSELNVNNVEFVSMWIVIKNKDSKNIMWYYIDTHTIILMNSSSILNQLLSTIAKENKEIYVAISTLIYYKLTLTTSLNIFFNLSVAMACYPIYCNQLE